MKNELQPNNFDLLRLLAAFQVVCGHALLTIAGREHTALALVLRFFPGVPIFFFTSGFLISASWERLNNVRDFALNRALRIFPGYWLAFLVSLLGILIFYHGLSFGPRLGLWAAAQLLLLPEWTPSFLKGYGLGAPNGALWTIPVEISFYISVPILYWLFRKTGRPTAVLLTVIVLSFGLEFVDFLFHNLKTDFAFKLLALTPFPWIGIFALGILAQRKFDVILPLVQGRFWQFLILYAALSGVTVLFPFPPLLSPILNYMGVVNVLALCALALAFAYTGRDLATRLLRRNDISYGSYLLHVPIANMLLTAGLSRDNAAIATLLLIVPIALLSWFFIEKPALSLRKHALYRHG
ncbi:MAG: acyltransferase [Caulobacteraceae bacterium]